MICKVCGIELSEGEKTCPCCGHTEPMDLPEESMKGDLDQSPPSKEEVKIETSSTPVRIGLDSIKEGPKHLDKKKKNLIIGGLIAVFLIFTIVIPTATKLFKQAKYKEGMGLLEEGKYVEAKELFTELGDFEDAQEQVWYCDNAMDYERAEKLFKEGKYSDAKTIYNYLPADTFPEAANKYTLCLNKESYQRADDDFKKGNYYDAYLAFKGLGSFEDASQRIAACIQAFPSTGEVYHNQNYTNTSTSLTIVPPQSDGSRNYLKIYTEGNELVSTVAIDQGQSAAISLPAGAYRIKNAYGYGDWFGDKDMFGDEGTYLVLKNGIGDNEVFNLEAGMIYTLTLRSGEDIAGDTVGSERQGRESF